MKKSFAMSVLAAAVLMTSATSAFAAGDTGIVNFKGSVIDTPCYLATASEEQTVDLGVVSTGQLDAEGEGTAKPFNVQLLGCNTATLKTVAFEFHGQSGDATDTALLTGGEAKGIAVAMMKDGAPIKLGEAIADIDLQDGTNDIGFEAKVVKGVDDVVPGDYTATTDFKLTYN
ncbi:fimbrial protein [Aeromonas piscicola]|uniref:fimbrial protein n=1 Tax=Aeromonas piscicola TaxID=600645 RepID=UPI0005B2EF63|nr:fimbrial protein [Aeromonas piscicola]